MLTLLVAPMAVPLVAVPVGVARRLVGGRAANRGRRSGAPALAATPKWSSTCIKDRVLLQVAGSPRVKTSCFV